MRLYYYKDSIGNFGDDLNPWLWNRLVPGLFTGESCLTPSRDIDGSLDEALFVGIGTLLNSSVPAGPMKAVFGSGVGYGDLPTLDPSWRFYCVRGPLSAKALGLSPDTAICDPAILLRNVDLPNASTRRANGYMPHHRSARDVPAWRDICDELGILYIDPRDGVEDVLAAILSVDTLFTEAMHGAIVADALRVPWVAMNSSDNFLQFKWEDWGSSLGLRVSAVEMPRLWPLGERPKVKARMVYALKRVWMKKRFSQLLHQATPMLSDEARLASANERLLQRLADLQRDLEQGVFG